MSNNISDMRILGGLFTDAAREVIERSRIKAQMNRIREVIEADNRRLRSVYAEIGRMYCEGTLEKNAPRVEMLGKSIEHLKKRIERATERYELLKKAHSVDECTEAFKSELQDKISKAQQATAEYARDLSGKAKAAAGELSGKASGTFGGAKFSASDAAQKAKTVAEEIAAKAIAAVRKARAGKSSEENGDDASSWDNFDESLDNILYDDTDDDSYIEEYTEEEQAAAADISAILQNIAFALEEVDNSQVDSEVAEEVAEDTAEKAVEATETEEEAAAQETEGEESPENFTF